MGLVNRKDRLLLLPSTLLGLGCLLCAAAPLRAVTVSPVQAAARPYGLGLAAPVELAGSDAAAARFDSAVLPGDFVDLPTLKAGSVLDFFLISDGAEGGKTVVTANAARNYDRLSHAVAFALPDSPYLILGFEDGWKGGDRDYNDVVIALNLGKATIQRLISAPEPAMWLTLAGSLALALRCAPRGAGRRLLSRRRCP